MTDRIPLPLAMRQARRRTPILWRLVSGWLVALAMLAASVATGHCADLPPEALRIVRAVHRCADPTASGCAEYAARVDELAPKVLGWCMDEIASPRLRAYVLIHTAAESALRPDAIRPGRDGRPSDVGLVQFSLRSPEHVRACVARWPGFDPMDAEKATRCWSWRVSRTLAKLSDRRVWAGVREQSPRAVREAVALRWAGTGQLCSATRVAEVCPLDGGACVVVRTAIASGRCSSRYARWAEALAAALAAGGGR